jgi:hypothetical protein
MFRLRFCAHFVVRPQLLTRVQALPWEGYPPSLPRTVQSRNHAPRGGYHGNNKAVRSALHNGQDDGACGHQLLDLAIAEVVGGVQPHAMTDDLPRKRWRLYGLGGVVCSYGNYAI